MAELRIPIIVENKGKKAFKETDKAITGLTKNFKKLAGIAGIGLGAAAIAKFGKNAAKAFIEDQKAATQLAIAVKNLGLAFETPRIEDFISKLSASAGVADDVLRPAMQRLLQTTGSLAKSQELLTQALDISRGSGVDYETVVQDLANAYVGNTRGLKKYSLGLTQAELKTMKFADVQAKLTDQFKGANAAYLGTYAGQMDLLKTAAGEATETIGKGLIDALMILSGDTTVEDLAVTMQDLAENTSSAITEIAKLGKSIGGFFADAYGKVDDTSNAITDLIDRITGNSQRINARNVGQARRFFMGGSGGPGFNIEDERKRRQAEADAAKRAKELAALQKKTLDTQKKQNALTKAAKTIDLERIGLTAALRGKVSETDRISLQLQLALLDKNDSAATKLSSELEAATKRQQALNAALLATPEAPNPFRNWMPPTLQNAYENPSFYGPMGGLGAGVIAGVNPNINITVELDGQAVGGAIKDTSINDSLSGSFNQVNRSGFKGAIAI